LIARLVGAVFGTLIDEFIEPFGVDFDCLLVGVVTAEISSATEGKCNTV